MAIFTERLRYSLRRPNHVRNGDAAGSLGAGSGLPVDVLVTDGAAAGAAVAVAAWGTGAISSGTV
jgi:hypothetical protein